MSKKNISLCVLIIVFLLSLFFTWTKYSRIKVSASKENLVYANNEEAIWKSDLGITITIQEIKKNNIYEDSIIEKVKVLSDNYIIYFMIVEFTPKVETLFVDLPINTNTKIKLSNGNYKKPINKTIISTHFKKNKDIQLYLEDLFEETISNNSPFTSDPVNKKGLLIFEKENKNTIVKYLEFQIFNSESDIGKCKIIFEDDIL